MNEIIELENIIPKDYQIHLENLMTSFDFPWVLNKNMVSGDEWFKNKESNHVGFHHFFFEDNKIVSNFFNLVYPMVLSITEKTNFKFDHVIRMRANLTMPHTNYSQEYYMPHIDSFFPHFNALYYVNDSDGDTVIFNQTNDDFDSGQFDIDTIANNNFTVKQRITPKRGKILIFPGKYYHSSSPVKDSKYRCVINMNLGRIL